MSAFKSKSSTLIRKAGYKNYKWHRSYYERILRAGELNIKREYIKLIRIDECKNHISTNEKPTK